MLEIRNLRCRGLAPVSFTLAPGECIAVAGASGAGKTLLLRAIADLDPSEGELSLDGVSREAIPAHRWRRMVTYVPAESGWWADKVADHIRDARACAALLEALGLPAAAVEWDVARLSTGEKQRLALVRAVAMGPRALLLDEPTSGLDAHATADVERLLRRLLDQGIALVIVTHDREQAARLARRRLEIEGGRVNEARD